MKIKLFILGSLLVLSAVVIAMGVTPRGNGGPAVSSLAPDFELKDLAGNLVRLSDYRGKVVFLNFWATWCPPCREEIPSIQALGKNFTWEKFKIVAVSLDRVSTAAVKDFAAKNNISFLVLHDTDGAAAEKYRVLSIPTTFILDRNGVVIKKYIGSRNWQDPAFIQELRKLF